MTPPSIWAAAWAFSHSTAILNCNNWPALARESGSLSGRDRQVLVAVVVTSAATDDGAAAPEVLSQITPEDFPRLETIFGDNKYRNHALNAWLAVHRPDWRVEVGTRPEGTKGFTPLRKRWVVERTNAWNGRSRRNSKGYERRVDSSAAMIQISNIHLMLRRLAPVPQPEFHYAVAA